jgi:hypothetical protein
MTISEHYPGGRSALRAAAIVLLLLVSAPVASAETVTYSTSGLFIGPGAIDGGTKLRSDNGAGTAVLSFKGMSPPAQVQINPPPVAEIKLGDFFLTSGDQFDFLTGQFKLTLNQWAPTVGANSTSTSLLLGVVSKSAGGAALYFDDPTFTIGGVSYQVNPLVLVPVGSTKQFKGSLTAAVVPLPVAAWGGLALMGSIGAYRIRRRRAATIT